MFFFVLLLNFSRLSKKEREREEKKLWTEWEKVKRAFDMTSEPINFVYTFPFLFSRRVFLYTNRSDCVRQPFMDKIESDLIAWQWYVHIIKRWFCICWLVGLLVGWMLLRWHMKSINQRESINQAKKKHPHQAFFLSHSLFFFSRLLFHIIQTWSWFATAIIFPKFKIFLWITES